jgi:hypothetical protein
MWTMYVCVKFQADHNGSQCDKLTCLKLWSFRYHFVELQTSPDFTRSGTISVSWTVLPVARPGIKWYSAATARFAWFGGSHAMKIHTVASSCMTPRSLVGGQQRFRRNSQKMQQLSSEMLTRKKRKLLPFTMKREAKYSFTTSTKNNFFHSESANTLYWRWRYYASSKC